MSWRSRSTGLLAGASLLLLALSAQASPVAALRAVGQGEMHWLWFKLYDATLYSHDGRYHPDARPLALTLRYARGLKTSDNGDVRGFSLDGKTECRAIIRNDKIVIFTAEKPEYLYYSWKPFSDANLVNGDDLPASTFRVKAP